MAGGDVGQEDEGEEEGVGDRRFGDSWYSYLPSFPPRLLLISVAFLHFASLDPKTTFVSDCIPRCSSRPAAKESASRRRLSLSLSPTAANLDPPPENQVTSLEPTRPDFAAVPLDLCVPAPQPPLLRGVTPTQLICTTATPSGDRREKHPPDVSRLDEFWLLPLQVLLLVWFVP